MFDEEISVRDKMKTTAKANYSISWLKERMAQKTEIYKQKI